MEYWICLVKSDGVYKSSNMLIQAGSHHASGFFVYVKPHVLRGAVILVLTFLMPFAYVFLIFLIQVGLEIVYPKSSQ